MHRHGATAHPSDRRLSVATLWAPLLLFALTVALGTWGFFDFFQTVAQEAPTATAPRLRDAFFHAVGLPLLDNMDVAEFDAIPWQLDLARLLGVITFAWATALALIALFGNSVKGFRIRAWRWLPSARGRGHAVVCVGWTGEELVRDLRSKRWRVAVIEKDEANPFRSSAGARGAVVIQGDALDLRTLDRADVCSAGKIFIPGDDDETNLRILKQIATLRASRSNCRAGQCSIHIRDARTREIIHRSVAADHELYVDCFDTAEATARLLMERFPFDGAPGEDRRDVHVIVFGYGAMARALLLQTMLLGHFLRGRRLRVTVVTENAEGCREQFLRAFPCFRPGSMGDDPSARRLREETLPEVKFLELPAADADLLDPMGSLLSSVGPESVTTLYLCLDDGMRSSAYAATVLPALAGRAEAVSAAVQLFCYYNYPDDEHRPLVETSLQALAPAVPVHAFANFVHGFTADTVEGRPADDVARQVARFHQETWRSEPWEALDEGDRISNRRAADHVGVKLRCIGADIVGLDAPGWELEFTDAEVVERLAELEHRRWCAERLLSGWRALPRTPENESSWRRRKEELKRRKLHPDLVPFDELSEQERQKDHVQIRQIPRFLHAVGRKAQRASAPTGEKLQRTELAART